MDRRSGRQVGRELAALDNAFEQLIRILTAHG
jgi:hypothetical protein